MPTARDNMAMGVANGILYAAGGDPAGPGVLATLEAYDPVTNTWTTKAPMPTPRNYLASAGGVVNGVFYVVGGYNSGYLTTVEAYDPATNTWATKAPMPTPRSSLAVGVVNGILYAVGGENNTGRLATVEAYDPATNTWTTKAPMPTARYGLTIGVVNGIIYAVGGIDGNYSTKVEAYDPTTNTWTTKAPMPTARMYMAAGVANGVLYAVGGYNVNYNPRWLSIVEAYDPATNTWTTKAPMPTARTFLAAGVAHGILYAVGGINNGTFLGTVEALTPPSVGDQCLNGDLNGDGKIDFWCYQSDGNWGVTLMNTGISDLLTGVSNGIGGQTTIAYQPSSVFWSSSDTGWNLPFINQNVSSMITCDKYNGSSCTGNVMTTDYTYSGGYYNQKDREFRGYSYVKATNAANNNTTETWFHQGNGTSAAPDNGSDSPGYTAGRPYRTIVKDSAGVVRSQKDILYASDVDGSAPYFTPVQQEDNWFCDAPGTCKQTRSILTFDHTNSNLTREDQYGDLSVTTDDRTVTKSYAPNTTAWILGLPTSEITYQGIGTTPQVARTDFYYDGVTDCNTASTNQTPTKGDLTRTARWLSGGTSPEARMAYDIYGNLLCTRDPNGNTITLSYDASSTFPKIATNALGQQTTTQYYGVDGVMADTGLYGQVKNMTDPNGSVTTTTYDKFGRRTQITYPNTLLKTFNYPCVTSTGCTPDSTNVFGNVGSQHVKESGGGLSSWTYFDGLGRTIAEETTGPGASIVRVDRDYNNLGQLFHKTLPYSFGGSSNGTVTYAYDTIGRVSQITNPDNTRTLFCYSLWATGTIDASNHMKWETKDVAGRLLQVDEYIGANPTCPSSPPSGAYATTTYQHDVFGNLIKLTDAKGNQTTMRYDTLGRKIAMSDPDMGRCGDLTTLSPSASYPWYLAPCWNYKYDAAGNLIQQTDAKGQNLHFQYDALNRPRQKDYNTLKSLGSGDVGYLYDNTTAGANRIGRLWQVNDSSGIATFSYDKMGRQTKVEKVIDSQASSSWTTQTVDSGGDVGQYTSITLDANGNPHISYYDATNQSLKYARWTGSNWVIEAVDFNGRYNSLKLDGMGNPHISYYNGIGLSYAEKTAVGWDIQVVQNGSSIGPYTSLALDSAGNPHISYLDGQNWDLKYAKRTGEGGWSIQTVDGTAGAVGEHTALALDSAGNPHISYLDMGNGDLKYARWTGSAWVVQTVDSVGYVGMYTSLALDSAGNPHISYYDLSNRNLKYAKWTGSSWVIQTVESSGDVGSYTSIALDNAGNPHISYHDATNQDLKYARWNGSAWSTQVVDSIGDVGAYSSLAIDGAGSSHISYYDAINQDLKYAKFGSGSGTVTYTTQTGYDILGRVSSVGYPDGSTVQYAYNGPLLDRVYEGATNYAQYSGYNALGQPATVTFGNGIITSYTYSNPSNTTCPQQNFRLCTMAIGSYQTLTYGYDNGQVGVGNITSIANTANGNQTFVYDDRNRLTSATGPYGSLTFVHDQIGNMLCNSQISTCTQSSPNYTYPASGATSVRPHAVSTAGPNSYSYDANGNMTGRNAEVLTYNYENRLVTHSGASGATDFVYDGDGGRVKKINGGSTFIYIGKLFECVDPCFTNGVWSGTKHIFAGSVRIASKPISTTGEISYFHPDHLGSTSVVTDKDGAKIGEFVYYPFGDTYAAIGQDVHYKYTGQEKDNETTLYFYNARYYDAKIGRFISADSMVQSRRNPQFLNRYSYTMNNPIMFVDPSGHLTDGSCRFSECNQPIPDQPNNPCVIGTFNNCGSTPPPDSGSGNIGNTCPASGCPGMGGTETGQSGATIGKGPQSPPRPFIPLHHSVAARTRMERAMASRCWTCGPDFGVQTDFSVLGGASTLANMQFSTGRSSFNILFTGGLGTSGSGENVRALAVDLSNASQSVVVYGFGDANLAAAEAMLAAAFGTSVNMVGHSLGAGEAVITMTLTPAGTFNQVFLVDCVGCGAVPSNANAVYNFYQDRGFLHGGPLGPPVQDIPVYGVNHYDIIAPGSPAYNSIFNQITGGP